MPLSVDSKAKSARAAGELASAVASQLSIKLEAGMTAQSPATDPAAFDSYLKARGIVAAATLESPMETWQGAVDLLRGRQPRSSGQERSDIRSGLRGKNFRSPFHLHAGL